MSYQVLARKWRPRNFTELVGQEHVVRALANGLNEGRIHHSFLFTGTRGVGKTTIARILAKSLNCEQGISAQPCGECEHCVAIDEGRYVDLLEIDAASRTKVDDTREILDNVQYAPARGRFKVYLIDEVHMLSRHSFNALLKTLEEPPEHVKFLLATTDPQNIPLTILSRCLQFNLRRLTVTEIEAQLRRILESEQLEFDQAALAQLARAADGSMRDALSLLDQALASGSGRIQATAVADMLGSVECRHVHGLVDALAERDAGAAIDVIGEVYSLGRDLGRLLADLAEALHRIGMIQRVPDYRDDDRDDWEMLVAYAARLDPEDIQLFYQIAVTGRRDLSLAPDARTGCEMTVLRMFAFRPAMTEGGRETGSGAGRVKQVAPEPEAETAGAARELALTPENWPEVLAALQINGPLRTVAALLAFDSTRDRNVCFRVAQSDSGMITERFKSGLEEALAAYLERNVRLEIRIVNGNELHTPADMQNEAQAQAQSRAEAAIESDPLVRKFKDRFGAEVVRDSIRPIENRDH